MLPLSTLLHAPLMGALWVCIACCPSKGNSDGFCSTASHLMVNRLTYTFSAGKNSTFFPISLQAFARALMPLLNRKEALELLLTVCRKHCLLTRLESHLQWEINYARYDCLRNVSHMCIVYSIKITQST